jgi:hypothetical protein
MSENKSWGDSSMLFPGMWVYKDVFKKDLDLINRVEKFLEKNQIGDKWADATVGYHQKVSDYRDCVDFKIGENKYPKNQDELELANIWNDAYAVQAGPVYDYCSRYNIQMEYWEIMNFIKYGPSQHFKEHADDGFSYRATVSLVGYPNSDYVGGGLYFPKLDIKIQPEAGDLYIFPSTYLFSHVALPVESGTKYSIVTMLDYNDHSHNQEFYQMRQRMIERKNVQGQSIYN